MFKTLGRIADRLLQRAADRGVDFYIDTLELAAATRQATPDTCPTCGYTRDYCLGPPYCQAKRRRMA